jgi:hypothetical protein
LVEYCVRHTTGLFCDKAGRSCLRVPWEGDNLEQAAAGVAEAVEPRTALAEKRSIGLVPRNILAGLILQRKTNRYGLQDVQVAGKQLESAVVYSAFKEKENER